MKKILLSLSLFGLLQACTNTDRYNPFARPVTGFLSDSTTTVVMQSPGTWELGVTFSAIKDGKVMQLGCQLPEAGNYTVSLWDVPTRQRLRQVSIEHPGGGKLQMFAIDPVEMKAEETRLMVSVNTTINTTTGPQQKAFYFAYRGNVANPAPILPLVSGQLLLHSISLHRSNTPVFPTERTNLQGGIFGFPEVGFLVK